MPDLTTLDSEGLQRYADVAVGQKGALAGRFRFGPYEADADARELRKRGLRIRLRDQSFEILLALLERPGHVVTREELRRRLWPESVHVEFGDSLNSAVNRLRG